jgi:uncharacterized membrane protein YkvI
MKKINIIVWENYLDNLDFVAVQYSMNLCNYKLHFLGFHHLLSVSYLAYSMFGILILVKCILWSHFHFVKYVSLTDR